MLCLYLEIETDEPHELNVRRRKRLPRDSWLTARDKAFKYALEAVDVYCDTSSIHPTPAEKVAAGFPANFVGSPGSLVKEAPSADYPWVVITDQDELARLQAADKAPPDLEINDDIIRVAFAGQSGRGRDGSGWDGWVLTQSAKGNVEGTASNCHVLQLDVIIKDG